MYSSFIFFLGFIKKFKKFFKEQIKFLTKKIEEKEELLKNSQNNQLQENLQIKEELLKKQNDELSSNREEKERMKILISEKERKIQDIELEKQKFEEENKKCVEKIQKQEEKLAKAQEKLKKYKEELDAADEEFKGAQNYIKKQKQTKENLEKQISELERKIKSNETNNFKAANNQIEQKSFQQTLRPSEIPKNLKPTLNKYPGKENLDPFLQEEFSKNQNKIQQQTNNNKGFVNPYSKEIFSHNNKIAEIQKDYVKNIYDEKYRVNPENNKKRKMMDSCVEDTNLGKEKSRIDFPKSFGFKQMKFI